MFIAQIYKFTIGAIINRPKKVCAIYAGEQCSPLQEKPLIERFLWPSPDGEGGPPNGGGRGDYSQQKALNKAICEAFFSPFVFCTAIRRTKSTFPVRGRPSKPQICAIYHNLSGCFKKGIAQTKNRLIPTNKMDAG